MNERIKQLWIDDLRNNPDKQGRDRLTTIKNGQHYDCCLGRLCKLAIQDGVPVKTELKNKNIYKYNEQIGKDEVIDNIEYVEYDEDPETLPNSVRRWAGMMDIKENPLAGNNTTLAEYNDSGTTFIEIADIIKKNL